MTIAIIRLNYIVETTKTRGVIRNSTLILSVLSEIRAILFICCDYLTAESTGRIEYILS